MKKIFVIISLFYSLSIFGQSSSNELLSNLPTTPKINDCYISTPILDEGKQSKKGFLITISSAKIEDSKLIFTEEDRLKKDPNKDLEFEISPSYTYYTLRPLNVNKAGNSMFDGDGYCLCVKERDGTTNTIKNKKIKEEGLAIPFQKLVKKASVTREYLDRKPKNLAPNQYWFETQNWTELKLINN